MDELKKAKQSVQNYSNTGDMDPHGNKATNSLKNAGSQFKKVMLAMQNQPEPEQQNESKLPLDQLIESIIKQKLLK